MENVNLKLVGDVRLLFRLLVGVAVAALVMLGVGGSVYGLVAPGGWIAQAFGRSVAGGLATVLALFMIGACSWMTREWVPVHQKNRLSELFAYVFAGAGALYVVEIYLKGGL